MKPFYKIFALILTLALMLGASVTCLAAAAELPSDSEAETTPPDSFIPEEDEPDIFDRFKEYINEGKLTDLVGIAVSLVLAALFYIFKKKFSEIGTALISSNKSVKDKLTEEGSARCKDEEESKKLIESLNSKLLESLDKIKEKTEEQIETLQKRFDCIEERIKNGVTAEQAVKLEKIVFDAIRILDIVYMGSSTIPSTVKERVSERYNHAEKMITPKDDEPMEEP